MKRFLSWLILAACFFAFCIVVRFDVLIIGYMLSLYDQLSAFLKLIIFILGGTLAVGLILAPVYYGSALTINWCEKICPSKNGARYLTMGIIIIALSALEVIYNREYLFNFIILGLYGAALIYYSRGKKREKRKIENGENNEEGREINMEQKLSDTLSEGKEADTDSQKIKEKKPKSKVVKTILFILILLIPGTISTACKVSGNALGGIPTIILFAPFIYWGSRVWRSGENKSKENPQEESQADQKRLMDGKKADIEKVLRANTSTDELALYTLEYPMDSAGINRAFNYYMVIDTIIITAFLVRALCLRKISDKGKAYDFSDKYLNTVQRGLNVFGIPEYVIKQMLENRSSFYNDIYAATPGELSNKAEALYEEFTMILSQDYCKNGYEPFTKDSPACVMDAYVKSYIETSAKECVYGIPEAFRQKVNAALQEVAA